MVCPLMAAVAALLSGYHGVALGNYYHTGRGAAVIGCNSLQLVPVDSYYVVAVVVSADVVAVEFGSILPPMPRYQAY